VNNLRDKLEATKIKSLTIDKDDLRPATDPNRLSLVDAKNRFCKNQDILLES